ncbi:hypothetical protein N7541_011394 [Penicillium brevicompactum]|uniref:Uncharacterized protein n=1 Tax=Penicillium brevicompactum TaxID=5074 RepID=A0A9W9QQQ3_PENBR|nr:hypothetical protein N7541_011394 [Penicillium brevicompactum]
MSVGDMLDKLLVAEISETSGAAYRVILRANLVATARADKTPYHSEQNYEVFTDRYHVFNQ